jgi:hypothetical protein
MFAAKAAILVQLNAVRGILFILLGVVIALLALIAGKHNAGTIILNCH